MKTKTHYNVPPIQPAIPLIFITKYFVQYVIISLAIYIFMFSDKTHLLIYFAYQMPSCVILSFRFRHLYDYAITSNTSVRQPLQSVKRKTQRKCIIINLMQLWLGECLIHMLHFYVIPIKFII